nr:DUF3422 domain-containing protein [Flexivirga aerilata]
MRRPLLDELHARAAPRFSAPARVVHLALKDPGDSVARDRAEDRRMLSELAGEPVPDRRSFEFERRGYTIDWENHTEYAGYTALLRNNRSAPFSADPAALFPPEWEASGNARRIAAVVIEVLPMPADDAQLVAQLEQWLDPRRTIVMRVLDGGAVIAGDFRRDEYGYTRFVVFVSPETGPGRTGYTVQRLLDLETYRALAMIGFLSSRELTSRLNQLDPKLRTLVEHVDSEERNAEEVLHELLTLTGELEALAMQNDFRLGATQAYAAIVESRLDALGDERFRGRQTLRDFLARRYEPSIRTAFAGEARLDRMLSRASRAGDLLRTRVDVSRTAQNQELLRSLDERGEMQLQLQTTVEGLSVIAISYYAIALLSYVLAPFAEEHGLNKAWVLACCVPVVIALTWCGMRMIRGRIHRRMTHPHDSR